MASENRKRLPFLLLASPVFFCIYEREESKIIVSSSFDSKAWSANSWEEVVNEFNDKQSKCSVNCAGDRLYHAEKQL